MTEVMKAIVIQTKIPMLLQFVIMPIVPSRIVFVPLTELLFPEDWTPKMFRK